MTALSDLNEFPAPSSTRTDDKDGVTSTRTFSGLAEALSTRANNEAERAVRQMTDRTRSMSSLSEPRGASQAPASGDGPQAIVGSSKGSTVFAREELLVFADHLASLSSDAITRIVGGKQIEVHSPEEIEIAGRRAVHVTSTSYVDLQGGQVYIRGGGTLEEEDFPPEDVSVGIVADKDLRLKSANGALVACADQKLVLHSHSGSADLSAKADVHIAGGSIHGSAGAIGLKAKHDIVAEAGGDVLVRADGNIAAKPKSDFFVDATVNIVLKADGEVMIKASKITIDGDTEILGSLKVTDQIKSG
jgi:hypothetical protein